MNIIIPKEVSEILNTLNDNGYEAYIVGGCVRDSILGDIPKDWDITTNASPLEVKKLFNKTIDTGIKHGTVTVMLKHTGFEVTTYRIDGEYLDGRHPSEVTFTRDLLEDLRRRDFTINAMAYNPKEGLVDAFGGIDDIDKRIIKCVGVAKDRFKEDALRILRGIRFSAQLDFTIEKDTLRAMSELAYNLENVSKERIQVELDKLLISPSPEKIKLCIETGVSNIVMPWINEFKQIKQLNPYHKYNLLDHTIEVLKNTPCNHYLRWAALLHDVGKPMTRTMDKKGIEHFYGHEEKGSVIAKNILKDLRFDNKTISIVSRLIKYHDYKINTEIVDVRKAVVKIGADIFPYYIKLRIADESGKNILNCRENFYTIENIVNLYNEIIDNKDCIDIKDLAINGSDLIDAGFKKGPEIGDILDYLFKKVLDNPKLNNRAHLIILAQNYKK